MTHAHPSSGSGTWPLWLAGSLLAITLLATAPGSRAAPPAEVTAEAVALPGGEGGIGFDDLRYSSALGRVLVPAGRTGRLDVVDPATRQIDSIAGFSAQSTFEKGHGEGTTSAPAMGSTSSTSAPVWATSICPADAARRWRSSACRRPAS